MISTGRWMNKYVSTGLLPLTERLDHTQHILRVGVRIVLVSKTGNLMSRMDYKAKTLGAVTSKKLLGLLESLLKVSLCYP